MQVGCKTNQICTVACAFTSSVPAAMAHDVGQLARERNAVDASMQRHSCKASRQPKIFRMSSSS